VTAWRIGSSAPMASSTESATSSVGAFRSSNSTLRLGADSLERCGASCADPVALEGIADRFLPECTFGGRDKHKLRFAVRAVAALHGGAEPDLLQEVVSWQTDDSGSTPCSQRLPVSAPPPTGRVCPCARYARSYPSADSAATRQPSQVAGR
jgi:hypothetical protein